MKKYDFNHGWICTPLAEGGETIPVTLPHDAMRTEERVRTSVGEANIGYFAGGDYEYRKEFTLPWELAEKKLVLEFESVYHNAEVWVNGTKAAFRPYGYTNFYVELNPYLLDGVNEIRVIARNADQPNSRWYSGTGIYRPVWLYAGEENHIRLNGVKIRTLHISPAKIQVMVRVSGPGEVKLEIPECGLRLTAKTDGDNTAVFETEIPNARLWNVDTPNLYTARVTFENDQVEERFGIRTLTWDTKKGISINGERTVLRGACIHHDNGVLGACTYPEAETRRIRILKEAGYNAVRSAHNPASRYLLDACDRLGMLMMDEYVDCWYMHKTENDYASFVEQWWREDLKDMVEKDYNHPCVILYSTGNEVAETAQPRGIQLQSEFTEYLHRLDDTRPVTCGINIFFNFLSSAGFGVYSDEKAQKQAKAAKEATQLEPKKKKPVGSEFYNVLAAKIGCNFMKFGATLPPCDWKTRDAFAAMDIAGYNYGAWRYKHDSRKYPNRLILGSETLVGDAYSFWETAKRIPQVVGDFVWAGWDYIGECGGGAPEYADYVTEAPEDRIRGGNCRIDMTGQKTAEVDYTRVAFEQDPGPFLAVFPVYLDEKPGITGWQLTKARRSWSYPGCDGRKADVEVYARAAEVALMVNGQCVGRKKLKNDCRVCFQTVYRDGEITAVSYDASGKEIGRDTLRSAGLETELRLEPETSVCRPGEMVYFRMRYTDGSGETKPMEKHRVSVAAQNGEIMGAVNGSCYFQGRLNRTETPTFFGEAQTVVRAGAPGTLLVTVTDGARTASAEIEVRNP